MSLVGKHWSWPNETAVVQEIARKLDIPPAAASVLVNRGICDAQSARDFLNPSLEQLHSPWMMCGMEQSVERILRALGRNEKIVIYGDYDADGICATATLVEILRKLEGQVDFFLPSRFNGGYGLHSEALEQLKDGGADLVITVDCGINAVDETTYARQLGLDLIITDHHKPLAKITGAAAVLNPLQDECGYPFKHLAGVGIAFQLAAALCEKCGRGFPAELLDLVAIGTVADVVPLLGENRILTTAGLSEIESFRRPGLKALAEASDLKSDRISSTTVAFILAPSINAPGRLGEADPAARLLLERDEEEARVLAQQLYRENCLRRETGQQVLRDAEAAILEDPKAVGEMVITLAGEGWHHGIIGIVASRLAERYYRPVVLIALDNGIGRGSARSIPGFDITAALAACASHLERFGGHAQAAGLTIPAARVKDLRKDLNRYARIHMTETDLIPQMALEGELAGSDITLELARQLNKLQPFGTGNPAPLFFTRGWELKSWRLVGTDRSHLKLSLDGESGNLAPIFFSGASLEPLLYPGREIESVVKLKEGFFHGEPVLDIEMKDLRYCDSGRSGQIEVIDRRGKGDRVRRIKELLRRCSAGTAIFVATQKRRSDLEANLPAGVKPFFITSGKDYGGLPAGAILKDLILYDLPLNDELLKPFFRYCSKEGNVLIYLIYEHKDREINQALLERSLPDPDGLKLIYRALVETAAAGEPVAFPGPVVERFPIKPADSFLKRCQTILTDTGLFVNGVPSCLELSEVPWAELLERSDGYREIRELRDKCAAYQEFLLEADAEKLAAYWMEQLGRIVTLSAEN